MLEFLEDFDFLETAETIYNPDTGVQILREIGKTNTQLTLLHEQLKKANNTSKAILQLQINEIEKNEAQKFYKAFSYFLSQIVDQFSKIKDITVLNYFIEKYYQKVKDNLINANDNLDEINDKLFTKEALDKLEENKQRSLSKFEEYTNSDIKEIDNLIDNYKKESKEEINITKEEYVPKKIKQEPKKKISRYFLLFILGALSLLYSIRLILFIFNTLTGFNLKRFFSSFFLERLLIFSIFFVPFVIFFKKNKQWEKGYPEYLKEIENQRKAEIDKQKQAENNYREKVKAAKEKLLQHPMYNALKNIKTNHATFENHKNNILKLENDFYKRWMKTL